MTCLATVSSCKDDPAWPLRKSCPTWIENQTELDVTITHNGSRIEIPANTNVKMSDNGEFGWVELYEYPSSYWFGSDYGFHPSYVADTATIHFSDGHTLVYSREYKNDSSHFMPEEHNLLNNSAWRYHEGDGAYGFQFIIDNDDYSKSTTAK